MTIYYTMPYNGQSVLNTLTMVFNKKILTGLILIFGIQAVVGNQVSENGSQTCRRITADLEIKNLILNNVHTATPCACFERQMELEYSFQKIGTCYKQWFSENGLKQMCCYDAYGTLLLGPKYGGYLIPDVLEPDIVNIHEACCEDVDLCKQFYQTFPSNNCSGRTHMKHATSWGDPEITTVDHHTYSFNGHGEYTFLETDNKSLQIQARTDFLIKGNKDATIFVAFVLALQDNLQNDTITIVYNRTDKLLYLYERDGSLWRNSNGSKAPGQTKGFQLFTAPPYRFTIMFNQKTNIRQISFSGGEFMSVTFTTSGNNVTGFKGLAGNWQQGNYIAGNGTMVDGNATTERQMFELCETWTVSKEDSKFNYDITGGNFTYWNGNHTTPRFLQEIAEKGDLASLFKGFSEANITKYNETCRNSWDQQPNIQCLVTIAKTGDVARGEAVRDDAKEKHHNYLIIHNKPPQFKNSTPTVLNVTYGGKSLELDLKLCVTDDFDSLDKLTYKVITELKNYTLENGIFKWNVDEYLRYSESSLTFTVNDTLGFSTARSMKIFYCGCEAQSQCDFSYFNGNSSENLQKAACKCPPYSEGLYCEVQLDPCDDYTCNGTCDGSFNRSLPAWPCAECPTGRRSVIASYHQTCDNINECDDDNPCEQNCTDTDGSYKCTCKDGFRLNIDGHNCDDIDECSLSTVKCTGQNEVCLNTKGNFSCICEPGYKKKDGICTKIDSSRYVGHMSFALSVTIEHVTEINKTVNTPKNRQEVQKKLDAGFNNTDGYLSVEVFRLIVVFHQEKRVKRTDDKYDLRADYVVHWKNKTNINLLETKLLDSFTNFTNQNKANSTQTNLKIGNVQINLLSAQSHINNATTEGGLCKVPGNTDCAPDSTICIDKDNGEFKCRCKSGYTPAYLNNKYCTDMNECDAFDKNGTRGERCVHGSCYNSVGSWNCSCPADRHWQSVGNATYPVYRCQGNFSYIGNLKIFWRGLAERKAIINLIEVQLKSIYTNKTLENATNRVPISSLFVSATVLSLVEDTSINYHPMHKYNVMFNLRMGEPLESDRVSNVLHTAFNGGSLHILNSQGLDVTFIDTSYSMYNDSDNILCDLTSNGNCEPGTTDCRQHNGTTICECKDGYRKLNPSEKFCIDIDECHTNTNTCNKETCVNRPAGSWTCKCKNSSFVPDQDDRNNFTCKEKPVSQCEIHSDFKCDGGERKCINDTWQCNCSRGYQLVNNSDTLMTCKDIDECAETTKNCSGRGKCNNTLKGYTCLCDSGYLIDDTDPYNVSCNDIDECSNSSYFCGGQCNNSLGSWDCDCAGGYQAKANSNFNITCEDINECTVNNINCSGHGNCSNLRGGYTCLCKDGFIFNDTTKTCEDINECHLLQIQYICDNGKCSNTEGSWNCSCPEFGYRRHEFSQDVIICEDIDECSNSSYHCGGTCNNTVGSWSCECGSGYTREPDKEMHAHATIIACEDINECDRDSACIDGVCKNTDGSWTCVCKDGKEPKSLNTSTIICSGGYQYIATIDITVTASVGNKDHELTVYLETRIQSAYETEFPDQNVRVEIISVSSGSDSRKKRQTTENLKVKFILHFDEPVKSENITNAWHDYRTQICPQGLCKPTKNGVANNLPFPVIFEDNVEFNEDQQTEALCNIQTHNQCDTDSTICQYVTGKLNCKCKKGYIRKTDYECTVPSDACNKSLCQNSGTCQMINENTDDIDFECICRDGWTGKTCEDVQKRIVKPPETVHKTVLIATGSSLGAVVIILAIIVSVVCRWKAAKVKEAEKMSMKNIDNNDFKSFDGSFINTQYMREGQSMTYDRNSLNSNRLSNASLPYIQHNGGSRPQKLPRPNIYGSMPNLANGDAHFNRLDNRRYSGEEPKGFSSYNQRMESHYDADWRARRNNFTGRRSPSPDYGRRSSPEPDYHRMENPNRSNDSGVGNGNSSGSNEYRRPDKRGEYYYGNRRSTQF